MDLVPNHTSDKCKWFIESFNGNEKYKDFYIWKEGLKANTEPPNNWISVFSKSAWTLNGTRGLWYFHQFEYRQPDLNYANDAVKQEMEVSLNLNEKVIPKLIEDHSFVIRLDQ